MNKFEAMRERCKLLPHGLRARYMAGCRCLPCRAANSSYECERAAARKRGEHNGLVSAAKARAHILKLAKKGVGYKQVADASGVGNLIVSQIRNGKRLRIRANTERRILAVSADAIGDRALVDAAETWRKIERLIEDGGFSKAEIARRMGYKSQALQFRKTRVTAATALKVERFYRYYLERRTA